MACRQASMHAGLPWGKGTLCRFSCKTMPEQEPNWECGLDINTNVVRNKHLRSFLRHYIQ
eukprot:351893-Chlamydomonas_euryale.AAC.18